jgi:hypothetical protein
MTWRVAKNLRVPQNMIGRGLLIGRSNGGGFASGHNYRGGFFGNNRNNIIGREICENWEIHRRLSE